VSALIDREAQKHAAAMEQVADHARTVHQTSTRVVYGAGWVALIVGGVEVARERDADFAKAVRRLGAPVARAFAKLYPTPGAAS